MKPMTEKHIKTNIHPEWRYFYLAHIRQLRMFMRDPHNQLKAVDFRFHIKEAQREMLKTRRRLAAVQ